MVHIMVWDILDCNILTGQSANANACPLSKAPALGMWASELDLQTMEEDCLARWVLFFCFVLFCSFPSTWMTRHVCTIYLGKWSHQHALWKENKLMEGVYCSGQCSPLKAWVQAFMWMSIWHVTYLNIIADQVHPFIAVVFPNDCGLFRQDNAPAKLHTLFRNGLTDHDEFKVLPCPPNPIDLFSEGLEKEAQSTAAPPHNMT